MVERTIVISIIFAVRGSQRVNAHSFLKGLADSFGAHYLPFRFLTIDTGQHLKEWSPFAGPQTSS